MASTSEVLGTVGDSIIRQSLTRAATNRTAQWHGPQMVDRQSCAERSVVQSAPAEGAVGRTPTYFVHLAFLAQAGQGRSATIRTFIRPPSRAKSAWTSPGQGWAGHAPLATSCRQMEIDQEG